MKYLAWAAALICCQASLSYGVVIDPGTPERTRKNFGEISVEKTEFNPEGETKLALASCSNARMGFLGKCAGDLFEVMNNGQLSKKGIPFGGDSYAAISLPAGTYYMKMRYNQAGSDLNATGEVLVKPLVTNYVHVDVE